MKELIKYFPQINSQIQENLFSLPAFYADWNQKINLISRKDIENISTHHILHSLAIAKFIRFTPGSRIIDVGTGGGFPGIPLAILYPDVHFHLVDSIGKKIKVVEAVSRELSLKNVSYAQIRAEKIREKYDFVVSRAVTAFPRFVSLTRKLVSSKNINPLPNGIIYLKGGNFEEEIKDFRKKVEITPLTKYFEEDFFETKKIIYLPI